MLLLYTNTISWSKYWHVWQLSQIPEGRSVLHDFFLFYPPRQAEQKCSRASEAAFLLNKDAQPKCCQGKAHVHTVNIYT